MILAQSTNSTTTAWLTLAGALGGVLLTSVVAIVTAALNHRWQSESTQREMVNQRAKALRQERREAYARYWAAAYSYENALDHLRDAGRSSDADEKIRAAMLGSAREKEVVCGDAAGSVLIIAGEQVAKAVMGMQIALQDIYRSLTQEPNKEAVADEPPNFESELAKFIRTARKELSLF